MSCLQGKLWIVLERRDSVDAVGGWNINKITHRMTCLYGWFWKEETPWTPWTLWMEGNKITHDVLSLRKAMDGFGKKRLRERRGWKAYQ